MRRPPGVFLNPGREWTLVALHPIVVQEAWGDPMKSTITVTVAEHEKFSKRKTAGPSS
jgi:hypothetical protein